MALSDRCSCHLEHVCAGLAFRLDTHDSLHQCGDLRLRRRAGRQRDAERRRADGHDDGGGLPVCPRRPSAATFWAAASPPRRCARRSASGGRCRMISRPLPRPAVRQARGRAEADAGRGRRAGRAARALLPRHQFEPAAAGAVARASPASRRSSRGAASPPRRCSGESRRPICSCMRGSEDGGEPARCLVIEDSELGVRAGLAAGMKVWHFAGGCHVLAGYRLPRGAGRRTARWRTCPRWRRPSANWGFPLWRSHLSCGRER